MYFLKPTTEREETAMPEDRSTLSLPAGVAALLLEGPLPAANLVRRAAAPGGAAGPDKRPTLRECFSSTAMRRTPVRPAAVRAGRQTALHTRPAPVLQPCQQNQLLSTETDWDMCCTLKVSTTQHFFFLFLAPLVTYRTFFHKCHPGICSLLSAALLRGQRGSEGGSSFTQRNPRKMQTFPQEWRKSRLPSCSMNL